MSSTRSQIYLDNDQRKALKLLAASTDDTISRLVRRAVNRLLNDEFTGKDWGSEMDAVVERLRANGAMLSDNAIDAAIEKRRLQRSEKGWVVNPPAIAKKLEA